MNVFGSVANATRENGDFAIDVLTKANAVPTPSFLLVVAVRATLFNLVPPPHLPQQTLRQRPRLHLSRDQTSPWMHTTHRLLSLPTATFALIRFRLRQLVSTVLSAMEATTTFAQLAT